MMTGQGSREQAASISIIMLDHVRGRKQAADSGTAGVNGGCMFWGLGTVSGPGSSGFTIWCYGSGEGVAGPGGWGVNLWSGCQ